MDANPCAEIPHLLRVHLTRADKHTCTVYGLKRALAIALLTHYVEGTTGHLFRPPVVSPNMIPPDYLAASQMFTFRITKPSAKPLLPESHK